MSAEIKLVDGQLVGVADLFATMSDADGSIVGGTWEVVSEWQSFFARFVHVRSDRGLDIAIKFGKGWSAADTEYVAAEIARVRRLFGSLPGGRVEVPPVLGWSGDPAALALPFVEGDNLFAALGEAAHPIHADPDRLSAMIQGAGEALGSYHSAEEAPDDPGTRALTREDMVAAARRSGYGRGLVDRLEADVPVVRGYRLSHNDFTIGERASDSTGLVVLDPPHVRKFDHLHRDISAFTLALHRALIGGRAVRAEDVASRRLAALRMDLLEGYRRTGPAALDTDLDRWLLGFYELSRIGSQLAGRLRSRRARPAWESIRWWTAERRALGAPPG